MEIEPKNCLYDLLKHYKKVCEILETNKTSKLNSVNLLSTLNNEVWELEEKTVVQKVLKN